MSFAGLDMAWTAAKGAKTFTIAVLSGDMASAEAVEARRAICRACPSRVRAVAPGAIAESDWCGSPLADRGPKTGPPTCHCLLAGKTMVASQACPQGKWGPVERARKCCRGGSCGCGGAGGASH